MWVRSKQARQMALEHAQMQSVILQRTAELQILTLRLLKVQDEERRKLSRDLHDSTGQTLAALKISVSFLVENCKENPASVTLAADVADLADQAIEEIRTFSYLLHPPLLDEVGFACAAEWYGEGFAKRSGVAVSMDIARDGERLPANMETSLFRILQESLTNVHRHSGAARVEVCFRRHLDNVVLEIRDHGCGIEPDRLGRLRTTSAETGVGFAGMRERMNELNGKLEIESDSHGTTLRAIVPSPAAPQTAKSEESAHETRPSRATQVARPALSQTFSSPDCG
jgi:two-component system, NarL family, sensor kinase